MVTGLSYTLGIRVRPATLHLTSVPPAPVGASPSTVPTEVRFTFNVRESWRR